MPTIVATPGAANANSYLTSAEADAYFDSRLPLVPPWEDADSPEAALIMATRTLDRLFQQRRVLVRDDKGDSYYVTARTWTGLPATTTQRLAWPRTGMYDWNGNAISSSVIPQDLKDAVAEFAGQLLKKDTTIDNDIAVQGISSVKAGSVEVAFRDGVVTTKVLPDAVLALIPASWLTNEVVEGVYEAVFDVI